MPVFGVQLETHYSRVDAEGGQLADVNDGHEGERDGMEDDLNVGSPVGGQQAEVNDGHQVEGDGKQGERHQDDDLVADEQRPPIILNGHFLELHDEHWKSGSGNLLHFFLLRQIECKKKKELWFKLGDKPIRFSLHEFCLMTGLKCHSYPSEEVKTRMELVGREFVNRLKRVLKTKKLLSGDLVKVINDRSRKTFSVVDKSRCAAMYLVHSVILGEKAGNRVREDWLAFTVTPEFFSSYPWGRESYNKLLKNFNRDLYGKAKLRELRIKEGEPESLPVTYTISCFWQAFFVWAYEVVPVIGELVGSRSTENPDAIPRLLRWHRGEGEKNVHLDNLDRIFSMNEFHCSPMLRPSNQELESLWMEGFAEMEDVVDPMIDALKRQLEDVIILRPCDRMRIEAASTPPQEAEDAATEAATAQTRPSQSPPQQFRDDIERPSPTHFGGFDDYCGSMPSSSRRDNFGASRALMQKISSLEEKIVQISTEFNEVKGQMSTELSEMKEINTKLQTEMKKMSKRIDNLVRLSDPPQPRIKRPVYWLNSPSWTIEGKKRKAPSKIDIAKRIQFGVKRKKI